MKVPYIDPSFKVTSIHHCTVFWDRRIRREVQKCICLYLYICWYVCIEQELKTLYGTSEEEEINGKFSILLFKDFGLGTKFMQKIKSVC